MDIRRFDGVPIDLDRCSLQEIENLEAYSTVRLDRAAGELGSLAMYKANHFAEVIPFPQQLSFDDPEAA